MSCEDIPSLLDLQKVKKHAEDFGRLIGGTESGYSTNGVTGETRKTLPKILGDAESDVADLADMIDQAEQDINELIEWGEDYILDIGFNPASFTFVTGGTITEADVTVFNPTPNGDNNWYSWQGTLPKTIPANSTPASTGGISSSAWVPRTDQILRQELTAFSGNLTPTPAWSDVPAHSDDDLGAPLNAQALALAARSELLKARGDGYLYAQIRSYTGGETRLSCIGRTNIFDNAHGVFFLDANNHNGVDNDGTLLVDVLGRRWKRQWSGGAFPEWFGLKGDGVADDTVALQATLNTVKHVVIQTGNTPLVSAMVTVPARTKLEFLGGTGNLPSQLPASYIIKKSTMTTAAIYAAECATVSGGGLLCKAGNTGDGIQLAGNSSSLDDFYVTGAGRDGVRVGVDGTYVNSNAIHVKRCRSTDNGRYGYYIHDGVSVGPADANIGSLVDCRANRNGSDGFRLGHCFWTTVQNCNAEGNIGYGLYLSGINNNNYPECRWPLIIGGDFNEGNNGTVNVNQVYDGSYFAIFLQSDPLSVATDAQTGLQGGGIRNVIAPRLNSLMGLRVFTSAGGVDKSPLVVENHKTGGTTFPLVIRQATTGGNGSGPGVRGMIDPNTGTFIDAGSLAFVQQAEGKYGPRLTGYNGATARAVELNTNANAFMPFTDNDMWLGHITSRWSVVYAGTGTINTSDSREKTAPLPIDDVVLDAWGDVQLVTFKWLDAIRQKGEDAARWHFGVIAQQVRDAFSARGLDGCDYGLLCYDEWEDEFEAVTEDIETEVIVDDGKGNERTEMQVIRVETGEQRKVREAGNRWGIRPDQCIFLEAAYQRRRCDRIEARLAALEVE